ncbi:hypothetical protein [Streptomyces angustmyceticus]|uniref:hypothetical protein n=1 Tax=Streptomyces angustmyceticus TaxID=285578 RepID=UPI0021B00F88|nr:hypothetical protein [Streptomyces angustmyceticus]
MRTALVIGTGLIGTSAALALQGRGVQVYLEDHDLAQARTAAALGAGTAEPPPETVDLAIVAVPPAHVAAALAGAIRRGAARAYIDASDPAMWIDILAANPGPVADVLGEIAADLDETVRSLRALESADDAKRGSGAGGIEDVLRRGNAGRERVPGKHGAAPAAYEIVAVHIGDQPGELARIFADAGRAGVNIEDVRIEHATGQQAGFIQLMVEPQAVPGLIAELRERGWSIRQ